MAAVPAQPPSSYFGSGLTPALKLVRTALLTGMLGIDDFGRVLVEIV